MKIGDKEYSEILVTDSENRLLKSITDEDVIAEKDCKVVCVPSEDESKLFLGFPSGLETGVSTPFILRR